MALSFLSSTSLITALQASFLSREERSKIFLSTWMDSFFMWKKDDLGCRLACCPNIDGIVLDGIVLDGIVLDGIVFQLFTRKSVSECFSALSSESSNKQCWLPRFYWCFLTLCSQEWPINNFSWQYQQVVKQTSDENQEKNQLGNIVWSNPKFTELT